MHEAWIKCFKCIHSLRNPEHECNICICFCRLTRSKNWLSWQLFFGRDSRLHSRRVVWHLKWAKSVSEHISIVTAMGMAKEHIVFECFFFCFLCINLFFVEGIFPLKWSVNWMFSFSFPTPLFLKPTSKNTLMFVSLY